MTRLPWAFWQSLTRARAKCLVRYVQTLHRLSTEGVPTQQVVERYEEASPDKDGKVPTDEDGKPQRVLVERKITATTGAPDLRGVMFALERMFPEEFGRAERRVERTEVAIERPERNIAELLARDERVSDAIDQLRDALSQAHAHDDPDEHRHP